MTATTKLSFSKLIATLIFIASAAILIHPALAQDSTTSATRGEKVQQRIETRKENLENKITSLREKAASREAALKAKLDAFKDKRKAEIAARVNNNLNKINQNQTAEMLKHLTKMSALLDKLEARVNSGEPDIKNPAGAKVAIASARTNIATTSSAVTTQSQKDYTITITSESQVRVDAQKMRDALKTDLMNVRKIVIDAKQSVSDAIRIARGNTQSKEGTPSGQQ